MQSENRPIQRSRVRRIAAYLLSTKVLVGGLMAFVGTQAVEAYKVSRVERREDVKAATEKVSDLVKDLPTTSAGIAKVIQQVENLYISFNSPPAREYLAGVIGQLSDRKARYVEQERAAKEAAMSAVFALEAKAKSEAATKAAEEARAAKLAEAAKLEADAKAREEAAQAAALRAQQEAAAAAEARQRALEEARAYIEQRRWDRMPK